MDRKSGFLASHALLVLLFFFVATLSGCVSNPPKSDAKYDKAVGVLQGGKLIRPVNGVVRIKKKQFVIVFPDKKGYRTSLFATSAKELYQGGRPNKDIVITRPGSSRRCSVNALCVSPLSLSLLSFDEVERNGLIDSDHSRAKASYEMVKYIAGPQGKVVMSPRNYNNIRSLVRGKTKAYAVSFINGHAVDEFSGNDIWVAIFFEKSMGTRRSYSYSPAKLVAIRLEFDS